MSPPYHSAACSTVAISKINAFVLAAKSANASVLSVAKKKAHSKESVRLEDNCHDSENTAAALVT